ncbi:MAG: hypothetical protein J7K75_11995 [Desulfuromonas sp.]|nr:hypothetical protein [Desulfuromonas sp.]
MSNACCPLIAVNRRPILGFTPLAQAASCSVGGEISTIGLEFVVDSCPPYDDNSSNHYIVNAISCEGGEVTRYAHYGDQIASPVSLANAGASQNYRVLWNKDNSHIVYVHRYFTGTIDGKNLSSYPTGSVSTNGFDEVFFPVPFADTDNNLNPDCADRNTITTYSDPDSITDPCVPGNVAVNSNVHIANGNLSLRQPLFSEAETGVPGGISLTWSSLGSGWQLNAAVHYEHAWAPKAGVSYSYTSNNGYTAILRDGYDNSNGMVYPVSWLYSHESITIVTEGPYIKLHNSSGGTHYFSQPIEGSDNLATPHRPRGHLVAIRKHGQLC